MQYVTPRGTASAAKLAGIPVGLLYSWIRFGQVIPPSKDESGNYAWLPEDIERLREVVAARAKGREVVAAG